MGYPQNPPQGGYQQYLPPGQQPQQQQGQPYPGPQPGYPAQPQPQGYPQPTPYAPQPAQGYPAPQGTYGPAPVDFMSAFGQADLTAGGPPIPGGRYPMVIAEPADFSPTKAGDKEQWTVKLKVDGGEHNGRQLTKRITITPDSRKAMGMMYRQVGALTGLDMPDLANPGAPQNQHWAAGGQHLASLMQPGRPLTAEVSRKPRSDDPSRETNDVEFVHPRDVATAAPPAPQTQPQAPPAQPPAPPQAPPQAQPGQPQQYQQPAMPYPPQQPAQPQQPTPQQYGQWQAAQPHPGGTQEFAPGGTIGAQAAPNGQPAPQQAPQAQPGGTLPAPPWQQGQ